MACNSQIFVSAVAVRACGYANSRSLIDSPYIVFAELFYILPHKKHPICGSVDDQAGTHVYVGGVSFTIKLTSAQQVSADEG